MSWKLCIVTKVNDKGLHGWKVGQIWDPDYYSSWLLKEGKVEVEERDPEVWQISGTLLMIEPKKIRSGYLHQFKHTITGIVYPMMQTELFEIIMEDGLRPGGYIFGTFGIVKRGTRIGIKKIRK